MRYRNDYIYYRECYSNKFFVTELRFQVKLYNNELRYLCFDDYNHIKLTDNIEKAAVYYRWPKRYEDYKKYIYKKYPNSIIRCIETVVTKYKDYDYYH